jgi:acyl carrier protein
MSHDSIIQMINNCISEEFELDQSILSPQARFKEDLELDSLDAVDMVIVLEKAFGFKIRQDEAFSRIRTLGDLHKFVIKKKQLLED